MSCAPACAGRNNRTFLSDYDKRVFLCPKAGSTPLALCTRLGFRGCRLKTERPQQGR
jgi:hypothetical protein